jgi:serine/threonine protein kinase
MPRCPNPRCQADYPPGSVQCTNPFCQCLLPEAVIAGRYRIETLIGIGGMGAVYRVSDTFEMAQVALKTLSLANSSMDIETAAERFRREARYAHQLKHPNIVPVLNFGQDGMLLFLVMPLITGGTLRGLLKGGRPLPIQQALRYMGELAAAIDAIHAHPQQIVHRDIKPSNLLLHQDDGRLMVADFGIARAMQNEKALTQSGLAVGTEHYVAPEQEHGKAGPASDIYSMGVVAYQMFTGLLPYEAVIKNHAVGIPAPSMLNPVLPTTIDAVLLKAIEVEPVERYQSARAFLEAVHEAFATAKTVVAQLAASAMPETVMVTSNGNAIIRTIIPENPCSYCGRANRSGSHFCRYCGHNLDDTSPLVTDVCQVGYLSDRGKRSDNGDMLLVAQGLCVTLTPPHPFSLFAVADGLRVRQEKRASGRAASRLAIETVADTLIPLLSDTSFSHSHSTPQHLYHPTSGTWIKQPEPPTLPVDTLLELWVKDSMRQANQVIYHCNADYDAAMASTLTIALLYKHRLYVASVGDSRAYHYSQKHGLHRITTDHTLAAQLVDAQLLRPEEVYKSAKRNQHYRMLGRAYTLPIDSFQVEVEANDLVLLCTDGLWNMVSDEHLAELLAQGSDPQLLVQQLIDEANAAGGEGNVSAIVARVQ